MSLKEYIYKLLNKVCSADITQVILLPFSDFVTPDTKYPVVCKFASTTELAELARNRDFGITSNFVADVNALKYQSIIAIKDEHVVGICFLASGAVPARFNSGGIDFQGISVITPVCSRYVFKVEIKPAYRGKRIQARMLEHAIENLKAERIKSFVTTTDWTNRSFLKGAERLGFIRCGYAAECIVAGRRFHRLPKPFNALTGINVPGDFSDNSTTIRLLASNRRFSG